MRKMYLVSSEYADKKPQSPAAFANEKLSQLKSTTRKKHERQKRKTKKSHNPYKWVKMRHKMQEADIRKKALIQKIADFLQKGLPSNTPVGTILSKIEKSHFTTLSSPLKQTDTDSVWVSPSSLPSTSHEIIYETPKNHVMRKKRLRTRGPVTCPKTK